MTGRMVPVRGMRHRRAVRFRLRAVLSRGLPRSITRWVCLRNKWSTLDQWSQTTAAQECTHHRRHRRPSLFGLKSRRCVNLEEEAVLPGDLGASTTAFDFNDESAGASSRPASNAGRQTLVRSASFAPSPLWRGNNAPARSCPHRPSARPAATPEQPIQLSGPAAQPGETLGSH
jgi:hypothetical protein